MSGATGGNFQRQPVRENFGGQRMLSARSSDRANERTPCALVAGL